MKFVSVLVLLSLLLLAAGVPAYADPPPDNGGAYVIRFQDAYETYGIVCGHDVDTGLAICEGLDIVAYCAGDPYTVDVISMQEIFLPEHDGVRRILHHMQGPVQATLFPWTTQPNPLTCDDMLNITPLATGVVNVHGTDNTNSFGGSAHGWLTAPDGSPVHVATGYRCVYHPNQGVVNCTAHINAN
ncbi:MAG: hypothetical protein KDI12_01605 [Anaerolineae bacterium]|nr:hypothetical protein [Anaerolineae bacterium]MCB9131445.1 hypothetical protein [Anaerolineales bacterium]MCB0234518.1 hypothetical protein [Anaerolineae bacterium]MCB0242073.1 hypothetical protein [Anaerolineae bacterium]MCO5245548.1 hypothetical protein [Anaerolineae bacterium]